MKLPYKVIVLEVEALLVKDVLGNSNTEEVTRGMANVPDSDGVDCTLVESTPV